MPEPRQTVTVCVDSGFLSFMSNNPRSSNGALRRKYRARFRAMGAPCGICKGRFGPIHYDEPSDSAHPLSFVIDEIVPVSKAVRYGYDSREAAAKDWSNLQAAHYCCNAAKGSKLDPPGGALASRVNLSDGDW